MSDKGTESQLRRRFLAALGASATVGLAGCSRSNSTEQGANTTESKSESTTGSSTGGESSPDLDSIVPEGLVGKGPHGNNPVPVDTLSLSSDQKSSVTDNNYTIVVVYHYLKTDWTRLHRAGLEAHAEALGINIEGVYGAEFDASKQVDILNTLASKADQIDAVISLPVDVEATADAFMELHDKGVKVIFQGNVPNGMEHPKDYAGMVTVDNRALGLVSARLLEQYVGEGKIGKLEHAAPFYVTEEREKGAKQVFENSDKISVGAKNSFSNADETFSIVQNMLTANPNLKGLWTPWAQPPGMQSVRAARTNGKESFPITSIDLGKRQAINMAKDGFIKGLAVGDPYKLGVSNVNLAAQALLGNETPAYGAVSAKAVIRSNLLEMYPKILQKQPPKEVVKHFE